MNVETLKTAIRPGLAIWAATMLSVSFALQMPMEMWIKALCGGLIAEWIGERGVKRAKEMFGGTPTTQDNR